jgi:hypothetical protein
MGMSEPVCTRKRGGQGEEKESEKKGRGKEKAEEKPFIHSMTAVTVQCLLIVCKKAVATIPNSS